MGTTLHRRYDAPSTIDAALAGVDTVIHAAFITADRKQGRNDNYYKTNVVGTRNLVAAAEARRASSASSC